jgi:outer membrane protein assembly factor BamB
MTCRKPLYLDPLRSTAPVPRSTLSAESSASEAAGETAFIKASLPRNRVRREGTGNVAVICGAILIAIWFGQLRASRAMEQAPRGQSAREGESARIPGRVGNSGRVADSDGVANSGGVDWPQFLGPSRDSKSTEAGILTDWGETGPPLVWHRELGTSYGIGSVSRGRFYQFDRFDDQATLYCLDAETGHFLWKFEYLTDYEDLLGYNNGPRCSPVLDEDRVYIFGAEGMLYCVGTADGTPIWKVDTAKQFGVVQNFFGVGSTPVVEGDLLIVMVGGSPPESQERGRYDLDLAAGNGTGLVAFDKLTGEVKYAATDELASYATPQLATIDGRRWCFALARGGLVGFHPGTGKVDFHYPWRARLRDSVNASTPVVVGDEVFISETYGPGSSLLRVRPGGFEVVWRDPPGRDKAMQTHWNTAIYHQGYLYGSSGRHTGNAELRCVEWKTGRVMWSQPGLARGSLLYVDGHFVFLGEYGILRLVKATPDAFVQVAASVIRERTDSPQLIEYPAWAAPILSHGLLYVRGRRRLVCMRLIPATPPSPEDDKTPGRR